MPNYILLERIELAASAASVTFANIPQSGYSDLKIVMSARCDNASVLTIVNTIFNGSTSGYSGRYLEGNGSSASSNVGGTSALTVVGAVGASATANTFSNVELYVPNYTSNQYKSVSSDQALETNATTTYLELYAYLWSNTAAITSVTMTPASSANFVANSTFSLYGLAAVGTTPAIAPKASGGNITTDGTYWYHTFLSSGYFVPQLGLTCDVLQVAGGGGGGIYYSGGGGAGGVNYFSSQVVTTGSKTVTVGAGAYQANGTNSQFASLTAAVGGGKGGNGGLNAGNSGGSGGGGGGGYPATPPAGGAGTSGQGYAGGNGGNGPGGAEQGGGGGGASAVGYSAPNSDGGSGTSSYSSWGLATSTGQNVSGTVYYAGGGGGGSWNADKLTLGGNGGGGRGNTTPTNNGTSGTANTGGGGGGNSNSPGIPGTGGSGIVIIRYPIA
jgi:hypothetical protein